MTGEGAAGRMPRRTVALYALGSLGTGGFGTLPGLVLVYFLTDTLGVTALAAGLLVTLAKVWDVVIDPVIGARSDALRRRTGSRRRGMLLGAVLLPVFFALTFAVPPGLGPLLSGLWVLLAFVLAATAFSLFQVPYIALPAELARGYDARTRLVGARVVVLTLAILLFGAGGPALRRLGGADEHLGYLVMGLVAAAVLGIALVLGSLSAPRESAAAAAAASAAEAGGGSEPARGRLAALVGAYREGLGAVRRSQPFRALLLAFVLQGVATGAMLAGAQYVATWVLEDETAIDLLFVALIAPALLCAPLWGIVAGRIGKERAFSTASTVFGLAALALIVLAWAPGAWVYAPVAVAGAAYAGMQVLPLAMLPDVITHDARRHGPGPAGTFGGVWTAGETAGLALGTTVLTIVLAATGYAESSAGQTAVQSGTAVIGIVLSFSVVPAVLVGVSLGALARYPLRREDVDLDREAEAGVHGR